MNWAAPLNIFKSRDPESDPRLGDLVNVLPTVQIPPDVKDAFVIVGYPDDEGVSNNLGRVGAIDGPEYIRRDLYKMTPYVWENRSPTLFDAGNLEVLGTIEDRHLAVQTRVLKFLNAGAKVISLGGGHDYGYPDGAAFLEMSHKVKPLIINFDAHLDVRPSNPKINSGTPFRRLIEGYSSKFDLLEIGIQSQCNSREHYNWAIEKAVKILPLEEIRLSRDPAQTVISSFIEPFLEKQRPVFLSMDMDVFSTAYAPGCSQSWPTGLTPFELVPVLEMLKSNCQIKIAGFYEVSPRLDANGVTSKLAAQLIHQIIH